MRLIKIKRGVTTPQTLLDGELGYNINDKTLYIGNEGGKDLLFVGGSVYPKINADYNYYKKADKNATEGYLELVNGRIPSNLLPTMLFDSNQEEIFEVDYVYVPGSNPKKMFYMNTPYDFATIAPGVVLGRDINGDDFDYLDNSVTYLSEGMYGEHFLVRKNGASATPEQLLAFNNDTAGINNGLFICRYDGHVYRIESNGEECFVRGISTPPDVIDGGSW